MKPPSFDYHRAQSVADAVGVLAGAPDAKLLAGGQSLVPLMNLRLARPSVLVDINTLTDLDYVSVDANGATRIGCLSRHRRLETDQAVREQQPLLAQAAKWVAHLQVRARGTLGGTLSHADPAAELPAALLALDASVVVAGPNGKRRELPVRELATGFMTTTLEPDEMLVEVVIPQRRPGSRSAFAEVAPRHGDFATAGVGVEVCLDDAGVCTSVSAGCCGVASTVVDLRPSLEPVLGERQLSEALLRRLADNISTAFEPVSDLHASAEDRRELAAVVAADALRMAWPNGHSHAERAR